MAEPAKPRERERGSKPYVCRGLRRRARSARHRHEERPLSRVRSPRARAHLRTRARGPRSKRPPRRADAHAAEATSSRAQDAGGQARRAQLSRAVARPRTPHRPRARRTRRQARRCASGLASTVSVPHNSSPAPTTTARRFPVLRFRFLHTGRRCGRARDDEDGCYRPDREHTHHQHGGDVTRFAANSCRLARLCDCSDGSPLRVEKVPKRTEGPPRHLAPDALVALQVPSDDLGGGELLFDGRQKSLERHVCPSLLLGP